MRNYQLFEANGQEYAFYTENGIRTSFAIDSNSNAAIEYRAYLKWVEAGNNPEDFWDRSDDLNETIVSEETLPSEEETKIETDLGE